MAGSYAARLKKGVDYGVCGLPEIHDPAHMVNRKVSQLVRMIKQSKHVVIFTGAGISTSVGIPDFRGPQGVWTKELQQQGSVPLVLADDFDSDISSEESYEDKSAPRKRRPQSPPVALSKRRRGLLNKKHTSPAQVRMAEPTSDVKPDPGLAIVPLVPTLLTAPNSTSTAPTAAPATAAPVAPPAAPARSAKASNDFEQAVPSLTHMAIVGLVNAGIAQYVISQNVDGLHLRSGLPSEKLSELHGNVFKEVCASCKQVFIRDWDVQGIGLRPTGRQCELCRGPLHDSLLDWDDALPERDLEEAQRQCRKADLTLCLGTSLRVAPANGLPLLSRRMVICNLQATAKDRYASLIINAPCDKIMDLLMRHLAIDIPSYSRRETVIIRASNVPNDSAQYLLSVSRPSTRDPDHLPFLTKIDVVRAGSSPEVQSVESPGPFAWTCTIDSDYAHKLQFYLVSGHQAPVSFSFELQKHELPKQVAFEIETVRLDYNTIAMDAEHMAEVDVVNENGRRHLPRKSKIT